MLFGPLRTDTRHQLRDQPVELYLCFELTDPRTGAAVPLPEGLSMWLVQGSTRTRHTATTDEHGCVKLHASAQLRNVAILIELGDRPWLDLDAGALLDDSELAAYERRPLVRLPSAWRSDEQPSVSDDRGGRFAKGTLHHLVAGGQGTEDDPWTLRIDHAWPCLDLAFVYLDTHHLERRKVTPGPKFEVLHGSATIGASTVLDDQGLVRVPLFAAADPSEILIRMRTPAGTFVRMTEDDPLMRVTNVSEPELAALPLSTRRQLYRLPETWLSRGQLAAATLGGEPRAFAAVVGPAIAQRDTVHFDLDDLVLVDESGVPIEFADPLPIALFDNHLRVLDPNPDAPYVSLVDARENHLPGRSVYAKGVDTTRSVVRAIRRGHHFYDVTERRTSRGKIIGARAAMRSDHPIVAHPRSDLDGVWGSVAELHYFADVDVHDVDGAERRIAVALTFLSFRIRSVAGQGVAPAEVVATGRELGAAAQSWTGAVDGVRRDVLLRASDDALDVRFAFHFAALGRGRPHVNIFLWRRREFRAHAVARIIALDTDEDLDTELVGFDAEDGMTAVKRTLQHEIGHILGFDDEYAEKLADSSLPQLAQRNLIGYSFDAKSIMDSDALPRLRHYWALSRWLLQLSVAPLRNDHYAVVCDTSPAGRPHGRRHHYVMPAVARSPFAPFAGPDDLRRGAHGRGRVELYLIGDELDAFDEPHGLTAVLHVAHGLYARFPKNANGDRIREVAVVGEEVSFSRGDVLRDLATGIRGFRETERGSAMYCAVPSGSPPAGSLAARHGQRVLLYFLPRFTYSNPAAADFRLHVRASIGNPADDAIRLDGRRLEITEKLTGGALLCHMLGLTPRQSPRIEITSGLVTSSIAIRSVAKSTNLSPRAQRASGDNSFIGMGDDPAVPEPVDPRIIASSIADAINDPANDFGELATATVTGTIVTLTPASPTLELEVETTEKSVRTRGTWRSTIEPAELQFLADWIGERLGTRYRIERHDP